MPRDGPTPGLRNESRADDYLAKPFDPTLLRARVCSSLEKKHMRDREREMVKALRIEKERSEQLLLNILPQARSWRA